MQAATVHPWNVDFRWADTVPGHGALTAEQVRAFDTDGFVVVGDVFTAEEIGAVRAVIDGFEVEAEAALRRLDDDRMFIAEAGAITFSPHLVTRSPALAAFARHPAFAAWPPTWSGPTSTSTGTRPSTRSPRSPAGSRGTRTTATPSSSRSST